MKNKASIAAAYYKTLAEKDLEEIEKYIDPDIQFTDPQETAVGKETFLKAAKGFSKMFTKLTIHAQFGSEDEAVIIYDVAMPGLTKKLRAASLLSFKEDRIAKIELIYDRYGFMKEK